MLSEFSSMPPRKSKPYCKLVTPLDHNIYEMIYSTTELYTLKIDSALVEKDDLATSTTTTTSSSTSTSGLENASTRITINLPSYKAFYYFFRYAGQRAEFRGYGDGVLFMIFDNYIRSNNPKNEDQLNWLIPRILTAPGLALVFSLFSDGYFEVIIDSAIKATKSGLTNIGSNATEVFEYYFNKNPKLIIRYIRYFINKVAQLEDILRIVSSASSSLSADNVNALLQISITENKEIIGYKNRLLNNLRFGVFIKVMSSFYKKFVKSEFHIFEGAILKIEFYTFEESILKIMVENRDSDSNISDILKILSISGLNYLQKFLEKDGDTRAFWFISKIEEERDNREKHPNCSVIPTIDNQLMLSIKRKLFINDGPSFAEYLSPAVLHELNEQFYIKNTILNKLLIAQTLIRQESCSEMLLEECAKKIAVFIEVAQSNAECLKGFYLWLQNVDLKYLESERLKQRTNWEQRFSETYPEISKIIFSPKSSFAETIEAVFIIKRNFEILPEITVNELLDRLAKRYNAIISRLRKGEKIAALRDEFRKIRFAFEQLFPEDYQRRIKHFSKNDLYRKIRAILYEESSAESDITAFGISCEGNILDALHQVFEIFVFLRKPENFYLVLRNILGREYPLPQECMEFAGVKDAKNFKRREEVLRNYLIAWVRKEIAATCEGRRDDKPLKTSLQLRALCSGLGIDDTTVLEAKLENENREYWGYIKIGLVTFIIIVSLLSALGVGAISLGFGLPISAAIIAASIAAVVFFASGTTTLGIGGAATDNIRLPSLPPVVTETSSSSVSSESPKEIQDAEHVKKAEPVSHEEVNSGMSNVVE